MRRRPSRRRSTRSCCVRGLPDELIDSVDGALLIDLWDELKIPHAIREAWQPAVDRAGNGSLVHPDYRGPTDGGSSIPRAGPGA